jgi:transposase-like protein
VIRAYFDRKHILKRKEEELDALREDVGALNEEMKALRGDIETLIRHHKKVLQAVEEL